MLLFIPASLSPLVVHVSWIKIIKSSKQSVFLCTLSGSGINIAQTYSYMSDTLTLQRLKFADSLCSMCEMDQNHQIFQTTFSSSSTQGVNTNQADSCMSYSLFQNAQTKICGFSVLDLRDGSKSSNLPNHFLFDLDPGGEY